MKIWQCNRKHLITLAACAGGVAGALFFAAKIGSENRMTALSLSYPTDPGEVSVEQIASLLKESKFKPASHPTWPVDEPDLPREQLEPPDANALGFGTSKFLIDSRWATIRYLGDQPAGAGLTDGLLNQAQMAALGRANDTVPVVTITQTINDMMDHYFEPLMKTLPRGPDILRRIKVQGAYFSPEYSAIHSSQQERDNAYVVGLQSLYVYPNSCFDRTEELKCNPTGYSAGHDPSIISHELGHVIFNHLRDGQSLEGWQWFAVNEGYADYFSAAYSGNPVLGRIWRVARNSGQKYLRRLLDHPSINDPELADEGHTFSLVWSSALWNLRDKIQIQHAANPDDFDRVVLMSINFLGESTKTRLGDAAAAILKAADVLGHGRWKDTLRQEFAAAEINLSRGDKINPAQGLAIQKSDQLSGCGVLAKARPSTTERTAAWLLIVTPALALGLMGVLRQPHLRKRKRPNLTSWLLAAFLPFLQGCLLFAPSQQTNTSQKNKLITYNCNLKPLSVTTPVAQPQRMLSFIFTNTAPTPSSVSAEQIFVGDERFENAESSLLLIVDREKMRIDQIRRRNGTLFQLNLNQKYLSAEEAIAVQNARLSSIIIEGASRAILNQRKAQATGTEQTKLSAITFDYTGLNLSATSDQHLIGPNGFAPLAKEVFIDDALLCQLETVNQ